VIRHIVLLELNADATPQRIAEIERQLTALACPGRTSFAMGADLGLREGNMDLAIVCDFTDANAYLAYDADAEHNRIRAGLIAPLTVRVERSQFEL
jgi:hypothetical protein